MATQAFTVSGSWVAPFTGAIDLAQLWGSGGHGEDSSGLGGVRGGGGGGGGGYAEATSTINVVLGTSYAIAIQPSNNAGLTTFASTVLSASNGADGNTGGGVGGTGGGSAITGNANGGTGGAASAATEGGGGGSSAGPGGAGAVGADGGVASPGAGGDGSTVNAGMGFTGSGGNANNGAGVNYGGGGAGGSLLGSTGGAGAPGYVLLTWSWPVPAVSEILPAGGTSAGGTAVTITGTGFATGSTVKFGGTLATSVVVVSDTHITCHTPAHAQGLVNVQVFDPDGVAGTQLTGGYAYFAASARRPSVRNLGL